VRAVAEAGDRSRAGDFWTDGQFGAAQCWLVLNGDLAHAQRPWVLAISVLASGFGWSGVKGIVSVAATMQTMQDQNQSTWLVGNSPGAAQASLYLSFSVPLGRLDQPEILAYGIIRDHAFG